MLNLIICNILLMASCTDQNRDYSFDHEISQKVLENYLSRSIEFAGLCSEGSTGPAPHFKDNLRMITNVGAKFVGRAAFAWDAPIDDDKHYKLAKKYAAEIHKADPEIILQACVFETTYSCKAPESKQRSFSLGGVEKIRVPEWVFSEFGLKQVQRCFSYEAMLFPDGRFRNQWMPGASVPDVSQLETRLWFYYRARRYIDAGYEAIHFGQVELTGQTDPKFKHWQDILIRVRRYAKQHARRNYVLCDAHVNAAFTDYIKKDNRLFWDFISSPLRPITTDKPLMAKLKMNCQDVPYNKSPGGILPGGGKCKNIPQLLEFDNCESGLNPSLDHLVWAADEATWFANLTESNRNAFLFYACEWLWNHAPAAYLQMPGLRPATVPVANPRMWNYLVNTRSKACPNGFNQEETIKKIWSDPKYQNNYTRKIIPVKNEKKIQSAQLTNNVKNRAGLLGHWTFDNIKSNIVEDMSKAGNNAIIKKSRTLEELYALYQVYGDFNSSAEKTNGKKVLNKIKKVSFKKNIVQGVDGMGFKFDDQTSIIFDSIAGLIGPKCTIAMWIKFDNLDKSFTLFNNFVWLNSGMYIKYYQPHNNLYVEIFDGSRIRKTSSFKGVVPGKWMHLAFTADGKNLTTYANGNRLQITSAGSIVPCSLPPIIGKLCKGVSIDDLIIFNKALKPQQIKKLSRKHRQR